jgi:hypothetical protein
MSNGMTAADVQGLANGIEARLMAHLSGAQPADTQTQRVLLAQLSWCQARLCEAQADQERSDEISYLCCVHG